MKKNTGFLLLFWISLLCLHNSCSLNYAKEENPESKTPEFTFNNASFTRIEKDKATMKMTTEKMEQYKADSSSFAKNACFETFDKEGKKETEGSCNLISANNNDERYMLFGNIKMNLIAQNMKINAESLNFDKKNEQITSGTEQTVKIEKTEEGDENNSPSKSIIEGVGFSASGISKSFSFKKNVFGIIETDDEETNNESE